MTDERSEVDLPALLGRIIDDAVVSFAEILTPSSGNQLRTQAALYRGLSEACDLKAKLAEEFYEESIRNAPSQDR
jgi:hypothetical protein